MSSILSCWDWRIPHLIEFKLLFWLYASVECTFNGFWEWIRMHLGQVLGLCVLCLLTSNRRGSNSLFVDALFVERVVVTRCSGQTLCCFMLSEGNVLINCDCSGKGLPFQLLFVLPYCIGDLGSQALGFNFSSFSSSEYWLCPSTNCRVPF